MTQGEEECLEQSIDWSMFLAQRAIRAKISGESDAAGVENPTFCNRTRGRTGS